jgi:hydroxymethylglutaryl-CoA lyase
MSEVASEQKESSRQLFFCELLLRDGLQSWPDFIPTLSKLELARDIWLAGIPEIDLTSFVPPQIVPQFADADALLGALDDSTSVRVLTVNLKGAYRVIEAHSRIHPIRRCGIPFSASEPHNLANLRCNHATHRERVATMVDVLDKAGVEPMIGIATAWGCPIQGSVDPDVVLALTDWAYSRGVRSIMFGDTTGMADPASVASLFSSALRQWPTVDFIAHFHDNRGCGIANTLAALRAGVKSIDGCLGGLGGEPAAVDQGDVGESGNVVTEDLVAALNQMGYQTGIDMQLLLRAGAAAERVLQRRLFSKVQRSNKNRRDEPSRKTGDSNGEN